MTVLVDGVAREFTATAVTAGTPPPPVVIAMENSSSAGFGRIEMQKVVAQEITRRLPPETPVGLVVFGDSAHVVIAPSTDRNTVTQAIAAVQLETASALFEGTRLAADLAGRGGSVALLTWGWDFGQGIDRRATARASMQSSGARVFAFALVPSFDLDFLGGAAADTNGLLLQSTDPLAIADVVATAARASAPAASYRVAVPLAALAEGTHELRLADGGTVLAAVSFNGPRPTAAASTQAEATQPSSEPPLATPRPAGGNSRELAALSAFLLAITGGAVVVWLIRRRGSKAPKPLAPAVVTELALESGLKNQEFEMFYQPVVDLRTGDLTGAEALLRWQHEGTETATARQFIPRATGIGILKEMQRGALVPACELTRELQRSTGRGLRLAVNVSADQILDGAGLPGEVRRAVEASGLPPWNLELEIAEQAFLDHMEHLAPTISALASLGVTIVVDDFWGIDRAFEVLGFPGVRGVKIDLHGNATDDLARDQLQAAAKLAQERGLSVTAKRVESPEEIEFAREIGCDYVQGHAFGRPMSAEDYRRHTGGTSPVDLAS